MDQRTIRWFFVGSIVAMMMFVYATVQANRGVNAEELQHLQDGVDCLLIELADHRQNSHDANGKDAAAHGYELGEPAPTPPAPSETLSREACQRYFRQ